MRKITFIIDDMESMKELYRNELTAKQFDSIMKDQKPFKAIFSITGDKYPDRYELSDTEGNKLNIHDLNGYQKGCIINDCYAYFEGKDGYCFQTEKPFGVINIKECEVSEKCI